MFVQFSCLDLFSRSEIIKLIPLLSRARAVCLPRSRALLSIVSLPTSPVLAGRLNENKNMNPKKCLTIERICAYPQTSNRANHAKAHLGYRFDLDPVPYDTFDLLGMRFVG
jgi:hypothetical protein